MNLPELASKASRSPFYKMLLNFFLNRKIPFNGPHRFAVQHISSNKLEVKLPYRKRNLNHLKGLHACALATLCEITSGFLLISRFDPRRYRIILSKLEMEYHWQAKSHAFSSFSFTEKWLEEQKSILEKEEKSTVSCTVKIHDDQQNHVATGTAHWQLKDWKKARVKA